jgi:hypothetical protein
MDYELLLRQWSNDEQIRCHDQVVAFWRDDGVGKGKTKLVLREHAIIRRQHSNWVLSNLIGFIVSAKYFTRVTLTSLGILSSNSHI